MNLFVYGTLLFPEIRELVGGRKFEVMPAVIEGFDIRTVRGATFPGIFRTDDSESKVEGEILLELTDFEFARFDAYEDGFYDRTRGSAKTDATSVDVEFYEVPLALVDSILSETRWTREWFEKEGNFDEFFARMTQGSP